MNIINIEQQLNENIPELKEIDYRSENNRNWLSKQQWNARLRSIENKNLKTYHKSLSWASIQNYFHECIYQRDMEDNSIQINEIAYKLIRKYLTSEKFNLNN